MSFLFGGEEKKPKDQIREFKRGIEKSCRDLERERRGLEANEKKIIVEMKKDAKEGKMALVKIRAKSLITTRNQIQKFYTMGCQLQGLGLKLTAMASTASMTDAMKGASQAMASMNGAIDMPKMQAIIRQFDRESQTMDMKGEIMGDAIDSALEGEDDEARADEQVSLVMAELGIELSGQQGKAGQIEVPRAGAAESDLEKRLADLRKDDL